MLLTQYACGHVGTHVGAKTKGKNSKTSKIFIRWAEIRGNIITAAVNNHGVPVNCPDCGNPSES